jgi:hypothetical protein
MTDDGLRDDILRLERDIRDFDARASRQRTALDRERGCPICDPLYRRLTSIRGHLQDQLRQAREEQLRRRTRDGATESKRGLRNALASLLGGTKRTRSSEERPDARR